MRTMLFGLAIWFATTAFCVADEAQNAQAKMVETSVAKFNAEQRGLSMQGARGDAQSSYDDCVRIMPEIEASATAKAHFDEGLTYFYMGMLAEMDGNCKYDSGEFHYNAAGGYFSNAQYGACISECDWAKPEYESAQSNYGMAEHWYDLADEKFDQAYTAVGA